MALAPAAWAIGTHAETHALHLALVAILLWLLVGWEDRARDTGDDPDRRDRSDRWLVGATFVFALAVGNHSLTLLLAPPVGLFVLAVEPSIWRRPRLIVTCVAVLVVSLVAVYLELPLRGGPSGRSRHRSSTAGRRPGTASGTSSSRSSSGAASWTRSATCGGKAIAVATRATREFGPLTPLIPLGFLATVVRRPRYALLTGSAAVDHLLLRRVVRQRGHRAVLPRAVAHGLDVARHPGLPGGDRGREPRRRTGRLDRRDDVVRVVPADRFGRRRSWWPCSCSLPTAAGAFPTRYRAIDESQDPGAAAWVDHALTVMPQDALIVSWWSYSTPLWYAQRVEGRRPDLAIVDDRTILDEDLGDIYAVIDQNLGKRPVFVIRDDPQQIAGARPSLRPRVHRRQLRPDPDPGRRRHAERAGDRRAGRHGRRGGRRPRRPRRRPASLACRTSSRPTTRRPTSRASSRRPWPSCRRSPRRSRSSPSTTARRTGPRRSPTS